MSFTGADKQEEQTDPEVHPETSPEGHPLTEEVTHEDLIAGVDFEDETPEETHAANHPTPDHPTGRLTP